MISYIGAIDIGTSGVRFVLFDRDARVISSAYQEIPLSYPKPGWVEQDPERLFAAALTVANAAFAGEGIRPTELAAIGITNQRETSIVWDRSTGKPVYPAIVWQDRRTAGRCAELQGSDNGKLVRARTGLPIDPYFSATKVEWLLENVPGLSARAARGEVLFGTVDTWLLWRLAGVHTTDPTNASRTLLFDIRKSCFDSDLLSIFGVTETCLPEVQPSLSIFGYTHPEVFGARVPVAGVLGDQQAALFGQAGFTDGEAKVTWGTGAFLLMNTGHRPIASEHGLLTTIAYASPDEAPYYALEGSVFVAGAAIQWLRDGLGIIEDAAQSNALAQGVSSTDGVYFVPALTGLGAPYWDPHARGTIIGITRGTRREHIVRAALEGIAYQTYDVVRALERDAGSRLTELRVDGGAAKNEFLCQFQSDLLGIPVTRPAILETTALGAAFAAGISVGFWKDFTALQNLYRTEQRYTPSMKEDERERLLSGWKGAVERAKGWGKETQ
jgi:glycerol kinase